MTSIPCGNEWMDCVYYDPDICEDEGQCVLEDSRVWDEGYNTEYNIIYADMLERVANLLRIPPPYLTT